MNKVGRNDPCTCGSGKKYKKCCIDIVNPDNTIHIDNIYNEFLKNVTVKNNKNTQNLIKRHNAIDLLKIFALLQLQPQNHGKNIRFEVLITEIIKDFSNDKSTNYNTLITDLKKYCTHHHLEDPAENHFTDLISFVSGNSVIYSGIGTNAKNILQAQLRTITTYSLMDEEFVKATVPGIIFMLFIHNYIAYELNHTHRMFEEIVEDETYIPNIDYIKNKKDLFEFSQERIDSITKYLKLPSYIIDYFTSKIEDIKIFDSDDTDNNPLLLKPFIKIGNSYFLVMPTAELLSINNFIIENAKKHNSESVLIEGFNSCRIQECLPSFYSMEWKRIKCESLKLTEEQKEFSVENYLFRIDSDKISYVCFLHLSVNIVDHVKIIQLNSDVNECLKENLKKIKNEFPDDEILLIVLLNRFDILSGATFGFNYDERISQAFVSSIDDFNIVTSKWRLKDLSLWKYCKYLKIEEDNGLNFGPYSSHITKYHWFMRNNESLQPTDDEPIKNIILGFEVESDIRREVAELLDERSIPIYVNEVFGLMPCTKSSKYIPIYTSHEIYEGVIRICLLKYKHPIWIKSANDKSYVSKTIIESIIFWLNEIHETAKEIINSHLHKPLEIIIHIDKEIQKFNTEIVLEEVKISSDNTFTGELNYESNSIDIFIHSNFLRIISSPDNVGERSLIEYILNSLCKLSNSDNSDTLKEIFLLLEQHISKSLRKILILNLNNKDLTLSAIGAEEAKLLSDADSSYILSNQIKWMREKNISFPSLYKTEKDKINLFNSLVKLHFIIIQEKIKSYNCLDLLRVAIIRLESILYKRALRDIMYPSRFECYSKYYDVFSEYTETESKYVMATATLRTLIEFTIAENNHGKFKEINNDELDVLLAHIRELTNYGSASDSVYYNIDNPELSILPSGRVGIKKDFENNVLSEFGKSIHTEGFHNNYDAFKNSYEEPTEPTTKQTKYSDKIAKGFEFDWGIDISACYDIIDFLAVKCYKENTSFYKIEETQFDLIVKEECNLSEERLKSFKNLFILETRNGIMNINKSEYYEVYPWRFNRIKSYLYKPIIRITIENIRFIIISPRHLISAGENLLSNFLNGKLKIEEKNKKIASLLAERNALNGKYF